MIPENLLKSLEPGKEYVISVYVEVEDYFGETSNEVFYFPAICDENNLQVYFATNPFNSVTVSNTPLFLWQTKVINCFVNEKISNCLSGKNFKVTAVTNTTNACGSVWDYLTIIDYPDFTEESLEVLRRYQLIKDF